MNSILIVDDNKALCNLFKDVLENEDYRVTTAHDGCEVLEISKTVRFDVVLMDVVMPRMDGIETFEKLTNNNPETKVILMTAYAVEDRLNEALDHGAFAALYKPIDMEQLLSTIHLACEKTAH